MKMRICPLCDELVFDNEWINHYRDGFDTKHREVYRDVFNYINASEGVTNKDLLNYFFELVI